MRAAILGLVLAVLAVQPAGAQRILYATAATPGRVDGFCLRANGALAPTPSVRIDTAGEFPRRLVVSGDALYVVTADRVEAFRIGPRGGLSLLGRTAPIDRLNARDVAISPGRTMMYVPDRFRSRILGYPLDAEGRPAREFTTCAQGEAGAGFQSLIATDAKLYVSSNGGSGRIRVFGIAPDGGLFGEDGVPLGPEACTAGVERAPETIPLSERRRLNNIKTFVIVGDLLYAHDRIRRRIRSFRLLPDGNFQEPVIEEGKRTKWQPSESKTRAVVSYQAIIHHRSALLGTQFFRGRVDSYALEADGSLPPRPTRITEADLRFTPVRMTADGDVAYVAAGEYDRVIAYRLRENGVFASREPFSETAEQEDSFPNDVAVAVPSAGCGS